MNNIFQLYSQLRSNPMSVLSKRFNIPSNIDLNNPGNITQYLLNSGQISQTQLNNVMSMRNNPLIQQLMK